MSSCWKKLLDKPGVVLENTTMSVSLSLDVFLLLLEGGVEVVEEEEQQWLVRALEASSPSSHMWEWRWGSNRHLKRWRRRCGRRESTAADVCVCVCVYQCMSVSLCVCRDRKDIRHRRVLLHKQTVLPSRLREPAETSHVRTLLPRLPEFLAPLPPFTFSSFLLICLFVYSCIFQCLATGIRGEDTLYAHEC